jgi:hypothetical protein
MQRDGILIWQQQAVHELDITSPADGSKLNLRLEVFSRASNHAAEEQQFIVKVFRRDLFKVEPVDPVGFGQASHEWYVLDPHFGEFDLQAPNFDAALAAATQKILAQLGMT